MVSMRILDVKPLNQILDMDFTCSLAERVVVISKDMMMIMIMTQIPIRFVIDKVLPGSWLDESLKQTAILCHYASSSVS